MKTRSMLIAFLACVMLMAGNVSEVKALPLETPAVENPAEEIPVEETKAATEDLARVVTEDARTKQVRDFVERLYLLCLGRASEKEGSDHWTKALLNKEITGAEAAKEFIFSKEFLAKKVDDKEYVTILYRALMGREADRSGYDYWINRLEEGRTRQGIFSEFIYSKEFTDICQSYQVERGSYQSKDIRDENHNLTSFVSRLYKLCMGRRADEEGQKHWLNRIDAGKENAASLVKFFLECEEFQNMKKNDEQYIQTLYLTMMDRKFDAEGLAHWKGILAKGASRTYLMREFILSPEFKGICEKYQITRGTVSLTEDRDKDLNLTAFVVRFYQVVYNGYQPTAKELNNWTGKILNDSTSAASFVSSFFTSKSYLNRNRSNEEFVSDLYQAGLGKAPDADALNTWLKKLEEGMSREKICVEFAESTEFAKVCEELGIMNSTNGWSKVGNYKVYYKSGKRLSGWQTISEKTYYFDPKNNNFMQTGWAYVDGYKLYFGDDGVLKTNLEEVIGKQSSYQIKINKECNVVTVYAKDPDTGKYIIPVLSSICSTGEATPLGTFSTPTKYRWHELDGPVWGQWCTRITGRVLFHSVYYNTPNDNMNLSVSAYNKLGTTASHGCCRLPAGMAKWIYDNCSLGTTVIIYESSTPGPYGKPSSYKLSSSHRWDPTDPTAYYKCQANGCH